MRLCYLLSFLFYFINIKFAENTIFDHALSNLSEYDFFEKPLKNHIIFIYENDRRQKTCKKNMWHQSFFPGYPTWVMQVYRKIIYQEHGWGPPFSIITCDFGGWSSICCQTVCPECHPKPEKNGLEDLSNQNAHPR